MNPYGVPRVNQFWKDFIGSAQKDINEYSKTLNSSLDCFAGIYSANSPIELESRVLTAGSCFSEHITNLLISNNNNWIEAEGASDSSTIYLPMQDGNSFKIGNSYTPNTLLDWLRYSICGDTGMECADIYECEYGLIDGLRPSLKHKSTNSHYFRDKECILSSRRWTAVSIKKALEQATHFIFTLGMTEYHRSNLSGLVLPMHLSSSERTIKNYSSETGHLSHKEVVDSTNNLIELCRKVNPDIAFIITVSPVPMVATHSVNHVLTAHCGSKAILRSAATEITSSNANCDYFPSYEIVNSLNTSTIMFGINKRNPSKKSIDLVKSVFEGSNDRFQKNSGSSLLNSVENACDEITYEIRMNGRSNKQVANDTEYLLIGDSHIGEISRSFLDLNVEHAVHLCPGSVLNRGRFDICPKRILEFHDQADQAAWEAAFVGSFLNQIYPKPDVKRIIITDIGIHPHGLSHQLFSHFDYDSGKMRNAVDGDFFSFFDLIRSKHLCALDLLRKNCDQLILLLPPPVGSLAKSEVFIRTRLYEYIYCQSAGRGWSIVNPIEEIKKCFQAENGAGIVDKLLESEDDEHGNKEYYDWISGQLVN